MLSSGSDKIKQSDVLKFSVPSSALFIFTESKNILVYAFYFVFFHELFSVTLIYLLILIVCL